MKSGYNPVRRNRNIGTPKQGHGRANVMAIPSVCHCDRIWWENLGPHELLRRNASSREITFFIEQTRTDCVHACTVDDICHVLSLVPESDMESLNTIVLRQSTRKQRLLDPSWGRLAYWAELGRIGKKAKFSGPAVFLEAHNPAALWKWDKDLAPADSIELERLKADGHFVEDNGKQFLFHSSVESVRATQLYRTLLHEIGHWVDWLRKVVRPADSQPDLYDSFSDRYFARPQQERESFAHQYADTLQKRLLAQGKIPFTRIVTCPDDRHDGIDASSTLRSHA